MLVLALGLGACSPATVSTPTATPVARSVPIVGEAWVRPSTGTTEAVAAYMAITNPGSFDDALVGASSPSASSVEIHKTSTDAGGMTGMKPLNRLAVPAGSTVRLAPGGTHLMVMGLTRPLQVGDTIELDLDFEHAGRVAVQAEVRPG